MSNTPMLCIAGGGTGGHVMPALALADAARARWPELKVEFIGAERGLEARLLPERGEEVLLLSMHAVQGAGLLQRLNVLLRELPKAVLRIRRHWRGHKPTVLVGVGGYASVTGVVAALIGRIPVMLYEQNAVPGLVNRTLARFCRHIMLGFSEAGSRLPAGRSVHTGNIIRRDIVAGHWQAHTPPCLLVLGGSQGARFLNETVPAACRQLAGQGIAFSVRHVCGKHGDAGALAAAYRDAGITAEVVPFCDDMPGFYASGDLMIARAGAMTVGEVAAFGMPTIFVPLPSAADNHQFHNAKALVDRDAALMAEQASISAAQLADSIAGLFREPERLATMSAAARTAFVGDADQRQLALLAPYLGGTA
jgi:UDP-N-acetylglucosamine--N-acetylmuramyl-(pentapeptide) pyrophosphoryl-undecaprenol N-acetylglucosamine transferase